MSCMGAGCGRKKQNMAGNGMFPHGGSSCALDCLYPPTEAKRRGDTNAVVRREATALSAHTTTMLKNSLNTVNRTEQVAIATAEDLVGQGQKVARVHNTVAEIDEELATSDKLIVQLLKRYYTDRMAQALTCVVCSILLFIIVYATLFPNQASFRVPDVAKPPSPARVQEAASSARRLVTQSFGYSTGRLRRLRGSRA